MLSVHDRLERFPGEFNCCWEAVCKKPGSDVRGLRVIGAFESGRKDTGVMIFDGDDGPWVMGRYREFVEQLGRSGGEDGGGAK